MKIYAIKDVLIEYFQQPFVGPNDKQVQAALAAAINSPENSNAIAQAPHHFQLWELGTVDEESGRITPHLELVADCSSLIRTGIREDGSDKSGTVTGGRAAGRSESPPESRSGKTDPGAAFAANGAQTAPQQV